MNIDAELSEVIISLLKYVDVAGTVTVEESPLGLEARIESEDSSLLIGWHGATLHAFEHLVRLLLARKLEASGQLLPEIHVDVGGYKQRQIDELTELAHRTAESVRTKKTSEILRPMNAFERRIVHMALSGAEDVATESVGVDPHRRIVVKSKQD